MSLLTYGVNLHPGSYKAIHTESSLARRSYRASRGGRSASPDCTLGLATGPWAFTPKRWDTEAGCWTP